MLLASVALLAIGVPAAPAAAVREQRHAADPDASAIGIRLLEIPAARADDPRAQAYLVDHVPPGQAINRRVEVNNTSSERQQIELYAAAATIEENAFTPDEGRKGNELTGWTSIAKQRLELEPGEREAVKIRIDVPRAASKSERYGVIWAQTTSATEKGGNVTQVHRVGIRMYLDVGPGGEPPTDFRIEGLTVGPGPGKTPVVTAQVVNTGDRALDMTGTLTLTKDPVRAGPFKVTNGTTIAPGESGQVEVEVAEPLPAGVWDARLVLRSGMVERTAEGRIRLPVETNLAMETDRADWVLYSLSVGAALAALIASAVWYLLRRRARPGRDLRRA
ncbi:COG1470 family protein [Micromonospora musae]|uniref:COG1470 family protein n=1 Tax=Micromonospora musae TaxID=1894970 RepID=UPI003416FC7E